MRSTTENKSKAIKFGALPYSRSYRTTPSIGELAVA